jgi:adenylate cyclase
MERRLCAIMSADLVGFTRLMERDEAGTWAQIHALRKELIDPAITDRKGVIFKTTGDGLLAEFKNSIDAVEVAVAVQSAVHERFRALPKDDRLLFRVGIETGDVIVDHDDLIGDAVNVAARLQGVCQPGGVCFSEAVFKAVHRNSEIPFEDIGEIDLRNRSEPVRCFVWRYGATHAAVRKWQLGDARRRGSLKKRPTGEKVQGSALPTVAVLPFENFSNDEELGHFSSGIAEDITTALYRFKSFLVISRTSSFLYAGEAKSAQEIGRELGAHYVLEGSIRKLGMRVRITAQLIDVEDNDHVWAESYDIELPEIFEAQDQIVAKIVATLGDGIEKHRLKNVKHLAPDELEAYELMLRGLELHKRGYVSYQQAVEIHDLFTRAIEKDPNLGRARAWRVCCSGRLLPAKRDPALYQAWLDDGIEELNKVLALDPDDPETHRMYGGVCLMRGEFDQAKFHVDKAVAINPNNSHILAASAYFYSHYGEPEKALELLDRAITLNPHHPDWYWQSFGFACWANQDYQAAIQHLVKATKQTDFDHAYLAASHAALENQAAAIASSAKFHAINPETTAELFVIRQPFRLETMRQRLHQQLSIAGLE